MWTSPIVSISGYIYYLIFLMIIPIVCELFPCESNLTIFPFCQKTSLMSPYSLAAPSKSSSATMIVSSTTLPLEHSLPPIG
jgi:hypothetical protein